MASFSGTTSGSSQEDMQQLMDQRKRKRMISNRESARRSRMKKQKHSDDLTAQVNQLRGENNQIITNINTLTQFQTNVEAENLILRAQIAELSHRLQSLNEIINYVNSSSLNSGAAIHENEEYASYHELDDFLNPWNLLQVNHSIMAYADAFMY
ncbi:PREDICTED: bZIP transcription factor 11-like [Nicotiana attenuata]|uniref:Bzip transcription factor 11 n=1 Tax=Nicotiana attenuata TaxID=49451 RepID=A0A1J6IKV6_NICAT|nr:PREDICTED: bZIP transcription factor 11-like [Nicotiana attenuata]OIS98358.1 bzip transcription factor 11 [Nicotiana attenuata]